MSVIKTCTAIPSLHTAMARSALTASNTTQPASRRQSARSHRRNNSSSTTSTTGAALAFSFVILSGMDVIPWVGSALTNVICLSWNDALCKVLEASRTLHIMLLKYVQAFMVQTAHTAIANAQAK